MRPLLRSCLAAALLLSAACERAATGPGERLPPAQAGRFAVVVTGAESARMEGEAWFGPSSAGGREVWLETGTDAYVALTPPVLGRGGFDFRAGRHAFGLMGPVNGFLGVGGRDSRTYVAVSGTLRVHQSDAAHVAGEFEFTAQQADTRREVRVRGAFHALPEP